MSLHFVQLFGHDLATWGYIKQIFIHTDRKHNILLNTKLCTNAYNISMFT